MRLVARKKQIDPIPDIARLEKFIASVRWKFAKTMPKWPHWYTMIQWDDSLKKDFVYFVQCIEDFGYDQMFYRRSIRYLDIGEYKYWYMDPTVEETDLINRARLDGKKE